MRQIVSVYIDTDRYPVWTQCPVTGEPVKLGYPCKCHGVMKRHVLAKHYAEFRRRENYLRIMLDRRIEQGTL